MRFRAWKAWRSTSKDCDFALGLIGYPAFDRSALTFQKLMSGWEHALMKHSADEDSLIARLIEDDVLALFYAPKTGMNRIARAA